MTHEIHVPDMSCDHCRARIDAALKEITAVKWVKVDLKNKKAEVGGDADLAKTELLKKISSLGYHPE